MKEKFLNGISYKAKDDLFKVFSMVFKSKIKNKILLDRLEIRDKSFYKPTKTYSYYSLVNVVNLFLPNKGILKNRNLLNIYLLDLICLYRGWRHSRGLPVRGQRTWSNGWTAFKLNNYLKDIKVKKGRKIYGNLPPIEIYTAQLAEQVNFIWKNQWYYEWFESKYARLSSKAHKNVLKIDLYSMAKGNIMTPIKFKRLSKKKQQAHNKNHFSLGFDRGFTRLLLRDLFELRSLGKKTSKFSPVILHKTDNLAKKKAKKKKKVDIKAKKAAHITKKKSKKSAWD